MTRPDLPRACVEPAPAKINLCLHVTGRRPDGYHLLDSLVVFTELGDRVTVAPGPLSLAVTGPFAADLAGDEDNLCLRAARSVGADCAITLHKALPVASGIGGGSADAAAVLRALGRSPADPAGLGADVPVCLASVPARMTGVGEAVEPLPGLPALHLLLVNPRVAVPTPAVFRALKRRDNPALPVLPASPDAAALLGWLHGTRNDLQAAAIGIAPAIADVLAALRDAGARLSRMSGSGATCFGVFADAAAAQAARDAIARARPGWWVAQTHTLPSPPPAR